MHQNWALDVTYLGFRWEILRLNFARGRRLSSEGVPAFLCGREFVLTSLAFFVLNR